MRVRHFAVHGGTAFTREVVTLNRAKDPGRTWTLRLAMEYRVRRGRLAEAWTVPEEQEVYDAYWTPSRDTPTGTPAPSRPAPSQPGPALPGHAGSPRNTRLLTTFYGRLARGDLGGLHRMVSDTVEVRVPGHSALSGVYRGWDGFLEFRGRVAAAAGRRYRPGARAVAGDRSGGFVREAVPMGPAPGRARNAGAEAEGSADMTAYCTVRRGRIVRVEEFPVDSGAWQRFFGDARDRR
ncbi:nuclear transport factor 2 family protein [Streptomyces sp. NPDC003374]